MKVTQAGLYVVIGAISDVTIVYHTDTEDYRVNVYLHPEFSENSPNIGTELQGVCGTVRTWVDLGRAYSFVRNLGWLNPIVLETIEIIEEP